MCLIYIAHRAHPDYPLVVAANRDEFHARPSAVASWWADAPQVLAGRDLEAGGTWMGVTRDGRFAALTNFRGPAARRSTARSRGELVSGFLTGCEAAMAYLGAAVQEGALYNGFSLLAHDGRTLGWCSNRGGPPAVLEAGVYGLSNHLVDTPWPKVEEGARELRALLAAGDVSSESLLELLDRRAPAPDERLPDTGIGIARERALSARFIVGDPYGTRCSTALTIDAAGQVRFHERSFDRRGTPTGDAVHAFTVDASARPCIGRAGAGGHNATENRRTT